VIVAAVLTALPLVVAAVIAAIVGIPESVAVLAVVIAISVTSATELLEWMVALVIVLLPVELELTLGWYK